MEDGGPVFFTQERVGLNGRIFRALKFRSMIPDAEARTGPVQASAHDPRITRVGGFLRATAMDELPQLWNIFVGDMSFVGPRPLRPGEVDVMGDGHVVALKDIRGYEDRHRVRPGLTGLAQVYAPRDLPRAGKFRLDCFYLKRAGLCLHLMQKPALHALPTIRLISPAGLNLWSASPAVQAVVIARDLFDRTLADRARAAGAELRVHARVASLDRCDTGVHAVAGDAIVSARVAILACGASYALQRRFGLGLPRRYLHTAQRELPVRALGDVEVHFGAAVAPGGFARAVPVDPRGGPPVRIRALATRAAGGCYAR